MTLSAYYDQAAAANSITARAFDSLSGTSRSLLWYMDIEQMDCDSVSTILGIPRPELMMQTAIARYELRFAWLEQQQQSVRIPQLCKETAGYITSKTVSVLSPQDINRLQNHLNSCLRCSIIEEELGELHTHLRIALLPLVLGPTSGFLT